jgi:hypothetical protein
MEAVSIQVDALHTAAHLRLVERYGNDPMAACGSAWQSDPDYPECRHLFEESNRSCRQITDVVLRIMETPATSLAGIVGKMRIILRE